MTDAVIMNVSGIKCDTPNCDFHDDSVTYDNYPDWLERPCPKCGASLLTEADYRICKAMETATKLANKIFGDMPELPEGIERPRFKIELDGTGAIKIIPPKLTGGGSAN